MVKKVLATEKSVVVARFKLKPLQRAHSLYECKKIISQLLCKTIFSGFNFCSFLHSFYIKLSCTGYEILHRKITTKVTLQIQVRYWH